MNLRLLATLLVFALAPACSSREGGRPALPGDGPAYLAAARIWNDTETTSYFHLLPSASADTVVDPKRALEVPGPAKLYALDGVGWFAIGDGESPTIIRYGLNARGELEEGAPISLMGYGVEDLWDTLYPVSAHKAYYPDTSGSQLIAWDPTLMTALGSTALPETMRDGYLSYYGLTPLARGKHLLFSVGWFDWLETDSVLGETGLVVFDTETDSVVRYDVDPRCGGITQAIEVPSGDTYFVSSSLAGAAYRVGRIPTEPCALRIRAGEDRFDPDYVLRLADLTGGAIAGEPVLFRDHELLLRVFDEELATVPEDAHTWELTGQAAWRWVRWDVRLDTVEPMDTLAPSTADVFTFHLDDKVYASQTKTDYSETTLLDLTAEGGPEPALTVPGFLQGIARIR